MARELAVVKGLAVGPIETMVLAARVQLSRPGGQGVGCIGTMGLAASAAFQVRWPGSWL